MGNDVEYKRGHFDYLSPAENKAILKKKHVNFGELRLSNHSLMFGWMPSAGKRTLSIELWKSDTEKVSRVWAANALQMPDLMLSGVKHASF